jgi:hypothetical protein
MVAVVIHLSLSLQLECSLRCTSVRSIRSGTKEIVKRLIECIEPHLRAGCCAVLKSGAGRIHFVSQFAFRAALSSVPGQWRIQWI